MKPVYTEHFSFLVTLEQKSYKISVLRLFGADSIMRTFTKLQELIFSMKDLERRVDDMERKYDEQFKVAYTAIKNRLRQPEKKKPKIGINTHLSFTYDLDEIITKRGAGVESGVESGVELKMTQQVLQCLGKTRLRKKEIAQKLGKTKFLSPITDVCLIRLAESQLSF